MSLPQTISPPHSFVLDNKAIAIGDPLPWLRVRLIPQGEVNLEQFGGLRTVLLFLGTPADPRVKTVMTHLTAGFDALSREARSSEFAIVPVFADRNCLDDPLVKSWLDRAPLILDQDLALHRAFGIVSGNTIRMMAYVTDPQLIVRSVIDFTAPEAFAAATMAALRALRQTNEPARAPVLLIPAVFSPEECAGLISYFESSTPEPSGYTLKGADGKYRQVDDPGRKVRRDVVLESGMPLYDSVMERLRRRVFLQIRRYYMFETLALERILLACYPSTEGGHFRKHRDFADMGSHREFGLTINLNDDFAGGHLAFPEFPGERHKPPAGAALIYSGAITHQVEPVSGGDRYCLLSFMMGGPGMAQVDHYKAAYGESIAANPVTGGLREAFGPR
jgi:predicted 2-oxoglutarate/Fe(II)-dependent dioxygenase YbiX